MTSSDLPSHDLDWYRSRWKTLCSLLSLDDPDAVVERVRNLQSSVDLLQDAGLTPQLALSMVSSMEAQLQALYREKAATESAAREVVNDGDTYEQLQALLAREEKLKRELGVSSFDEVVDMVEDLSDQLKSFYDTSSPFPERSTAPDPASTNGTPSSTGWQYIQQTLGVHTPEDVVAMVESLTRQVEDLYRARERLADANLNDEDSVVAMITNMQNQLESIYESQERMSQKGVKDVDHALAMIETMDKQLNVLYEERHDTPPDLDSMRSRLQETVNELEALKQEKATLIRERDALRQSIASQQGSTAAPSQDDTDDAPTPRDTSSSLDLRTLEQTFGSKDPERIAALIHSMDEQLTERSTVELEQSALRILEAEQRLLDIDEDVLAHLEDMAPEDLHNLAFGVLRLDDEGTIRFANDTATTLPGCTADAPAALEGKNFFFDLVPFTNNRLFRGRFLQGVRNGSLDVRFPYTLIRSHAPPVNLALHLHRKPTERANWILFTRL